MVAEKPYKVSLPYRVDVVPPSGNIERVIKGILVLKIDARNASLAIEQAIANIGIQSIDGHLLLPYRFIDTGKKAGENYWWVLTDDSYYVVRAFCRDGACKKIMEQNLNPRQIKKIKKPKLLSTSYQPSLFPVNECITKPPQHKSHRTDNSSNLSSWVCEMCGETNSELMKDCCECSSPRNNPFADTPKSRNLVTSSG